MSGELARSALSICPAKGCGWPFDTLQPLSWPTRATVVLPTFRPQITIVKDAMARYWTCHWQNRFWRDEINTEYHAVRSSGSNSFRKRGVAGGDA